MMICTFWCSSACMDARDVVNMRPCMCCTFVLECVFHQVLCSFQFFFFDYNSVSWTPKKTGQKKEKRKRFDPRLPIWGWGSWSMSAPLRLHFPSVSFLFFPQCQAQTLKTSTLIGPGQREILLRLSKCDPRCQPGRALTECLQTNST